MIGNMLKFCVRFQDGHAVFLMLWKRNMYQFIERRNMKIEIRYLKAYI